MLKINLNIYTTYIYISLSDPFVSGVRGGDDEGAEPGEGGHYHEEDHCSDDAHETDTGTDTTMKKIIAQMILMKQIQVLTLPRRRS